MEIKGIVSDRASGLIKLGSSDYLGVCSMPDLFHFCQDLSRSIGAKIGRVKKSSNDKLLTCSKEEKKLAKKESKKADEIYKCYRQEMEEINRLIHPFNNEDLWVKQEDTEETIQCTIDLMEVYAQELNIKVEKKKKEKVEKQIKPIAQAIESWITATKLELEELEKKGKITNLEKEWLTLYALPYTYWEIQLTRTQAKKRNQELRIYYKERVANSKEKCKAVYSASEMSLERANDLLQLAHRIALTFQRSSSQVEGRNGYLSFINHAHKGIPKERLKVLTVIHNYDIKRQDGSTPAQRLFNRNFPDLFEFLCENVIGFKEPRRKKPKSLGISFVQP